MSNYAYIILITSLICIGGSAIGAGIASIIKKESKKTVAVFLAFAGGLTMGIVTLDLLPESAEGFGGEWGVFIALFFVAVGYGLIYLINHLVNLKSGMGEHACHCHCHGDRESESPHRLFLSGAVMAAAIAVHNLPVGMVIGTSYAASPIHILASSAIPFSLAVGLHNIPEGMAVAVPLISGGAKAPKAIIITALTGVPTVIGALLGYVIGSLNPIVLSVSLAFAAGAMLYVAFAELLPEAFDTYCSKVTSLSAAVGILAAFIIIFA